MADGKVQINGGKVLTDPGKVATADECCCYPDVDYGCCEGSPCMACNVDTGPETWRLDWTGTPDQGEHDLSCSSCIAPYGYCDWDGGAGGPPSTTTFRLSTVTPVAPETDTYYSLVIDTCIGYRACYAEYRSATLEWDGNCMKWYDSGTGYMTLSKYYEEPDICCTLPSTLNLWPV
jgi:hypothetical protein